MSANLSLDRHRKNAVNNENKSPAQVRVMNRQVRSADTRHYEWQELDTPARAYVRMINMILGQSLATNSKLGENRIHLV